MIRAGQAFSPSYNLAPPPSLPFSPVSKSLFLGLPVCRRSCLLTAQVGWVCGEAKSYDSEIAWFSTNHPIIFALIAPRIPTHVDKNTISFLNITELIHSSLFFVCIYSPLLSRKRTWYAFTSLWILSSIHIWNPHFLLALCWPFYFTIF